MSHDFVKFYLNCYGILFCTIVINKLFCSPLAPKDAFTSNSASNLNDLVYSKGHQYVPDFTVRALTDIEYIKVRRHQYIAAQRATLMERRPKTPRDNAEQTPEDPFNKEWRLASELNQHHQEEGTPSLPPYLRIHHRNMSSGNLEELRNRPDLQKMSPLVRNSMNTETKPLRTVIYPQSHRSPHNSLTVTDPEKVKLLTDGGNHDKDNGKDGRIDSDSS